jgi:hypothetical protein
MVWFYTADGRTSRYQDGKMSTDPSLISKELVLRAAKRLIPGQSAVFGAYKMAACKSGKEIKGNAISEFIRGE